MGLPALVLGAFAFLLVIDLIFNVRMRWKYRHIPGPPPEGSAGHLRYIASSNLFDLYRKWREQYGPIMLTYLGRQPVILISDADMARQVGIKQFQIFHDRVIPPIIPLTGKRFRAMAGLVAATGSYWVSLRSAVMPLFHTVRLQQFAEMMVDAVDTLVRRLEPAAKGGNVVDVRNFLGGLTMEVVGIAAFGLHLQLQQPDPSKRAETQLVEAVEALFATPFSNRAAGAVLMLPKPLGDFFRVLLAMFPSRSFHDLDVQRTTLFSTNAALVEGARLRAEKEGRAVAAPHEDWKWWRGDTVASSYFRELLPMRGGVIDMLLSASNRESHTGFTDRQITSQCNVLLSAGYETTASALSFTIYQLAKHAEAEAGLLAEIDAFGRDRVPTYADLEGMPYSRAAIYESMRLMPPVLLIPRIALEATQVGGYHIPKGSWVYISVGNLHMDPNYWPEPELYRPERFTDPALLEARHPQAFMPFGVGPRLCVGWRFAMEEAQIALIRLYQRYTFRIPLGVPDPPPLRIGITCAFRDGLPVHVIPRD